MYQKTILVPIADGIEELETVTIVDVLRRAGLGVRLSSIADREIRGMNQIKLIADSVIRDETIEDYDAIVLPGGTDGAYNFAASKPLTDSIMSFYEKKKTIAAICASPAIVLAKHSLLDDKNATCYPALKDKIKNYQDDPVVIDGNIITSQGPGTAMKFALTLAKLFTDEKNQEEVAKAMLFKG